MSEEDVKISRRSRWMQRFAGLLLGAAGACMYISAFKLPEKVTGPLADNILSGTPTLHGVLLESISWGLAGTGSLFLVVGLMLIGPDEESGGLSCNYLTLCFIVWAVVILAFIIDK